MRKQRRMHIYNARVSKPRAKVEVKDKTSARVLVALLFAGILTLASSIQTPRIDGTVIHVGYALTPYISEFEDSSFNGYTLFAPMPSTTTYLINNSGGVVHTWPNIYNPSLSVYLLQNGNLLRTAEGRVQEIDQDGTVVWDFECSSDEHRRHHDIEPLPNGNVLIIAWETKTAAEAIAAGRNPNNLREGELWPDHVIEVEPNGASGGNIVWEWHVWDHLIQNYDPSKENFGVVGEHPELVDINFPHIGPASVKADWNHMNSIDYNEELDQILLSVNTFQEIWVVDHSTTTEEAASHAGGNSGKGGDILYRWGNPQAYHAGDASDTKFFHQHDAQWIESDRLGEGNILVFNNGFNRPEGAYSSVDEIVPPVDENGNYLLTPGSAYEPEEQVWIYTAENPTDFYSQNIGGAQRLPNGNTLICNGANGYFFEVTYGKETIWEYTNPFPNTLNNNVFKICRYAPDFPGLAGLIPTTENDIAVTNVTTSGTIVRQGYNCAINVTVENQGSSLATFDVAVYCNNTAIQTQSVANLPSGISIAVAFSWDTTGFPCGSYTVSANATIVLGETDTADNTFTDGTVLLTFLSDITGPAEPDHLPDGLVDMWDFDLISLAYGKTSADLDWEEYTIADIIGPEGLPDGRVDIRDLNCCGLQYGESI